MKTEDQILKEIDRLEQNMSADVYAVMDRPKLKVAVLKWVLEDEKK